MKKITFISILLFTSTIAIISQTVVKMEMPAQSDEAITAETLFDESLPLDIPTILGPMGYDINGGTPPYRFQWHENEGIISNKDIVTITPVSGNNYTVTIIDHNNCSVTLPLSVSNQSLKNGSPQTKVIVFKPDQGNHLTLKLDDTDSTIFKIKFFNLKGVKIQEHSISETTAIPINFPAGVYILNIQGNNYQHTEKIIVR